MSSDQARMLPAPCVCAWSSAASAAASSAAPVRAGARVGRLKPTEAETGTVVACRLKGSPSAARSRVAIAIANSRSVRRAGASAMAWRPAPRGRHNRPRAGRPRCGRSCVARRPPAWRGPTAPRSRRGRRRRPRGRPAPCRAEGRRTGRHRAGRQFRPAHRRRCPAAARAPAAAGCGGHRRAGAARPRAGRSGSRWPPRADRTTAPQGQVPAPRTEGRTPSPRGQPVTPERRACYEVCQPSDPYLSGASGARCRKVGTFRDRAVNPRCAGGELRPFPGPHRA